jgi:hypothetical protein
MWYFGTESSSFDNFKHIVWQAYRSLANFLHNFDESF